MKIMRILNSDFVFLIPCLTFAKVQNISFGLNFPYFLATRAALYGKRTFSGLIVRVAIGAITVGVAAMLLSIAVRQGFKGEITAKQRGFFGDVVLNKYDLNESYEPTPFKLGATELQGLKALSEVSSVHHYATKPGIINVNSEVEGVLLKGIDSSYDPHFLKSSLVSGKTIDFSDSTQAMQQILISDYTANRLKLKVGDDFIMYFVQEPVRRRKFEIT